MKTNYPPKRYPSPFQPRIHPAQALRKLAMDTSNKKSPIRKEIEKLLGVHALEATVEEDTQTLAAMKHVEGIVCFLCTLRKNGKVLAQGRGNAVMNPSGRWMNRAIHSAFNSALADSVIRATKVLGTLIESEQERSGAIPQTYQPKEQDAFEPATDKQRHYLAELIALNVLDEDERERRQLQLSEITKSEASRMIESFRR